MIRAFGFLDLSVDFFSLHLYSVVLLKDMLLVVVSDCFLNLKKTCFESGYLVFQYLYY